MKKRNDFHDSEIMDALDAAGYNISRAAGTLGVKPNTLYKWIKESDNLSKYIRMRVEADAVKARDTLNDILDRADLDDPRMTSNVVSICKILLDKAESDKQSLDIFQVEGKAPQHMLEEKLKKLLEE